MDKIMKTESYESLPLPDFDSELTLDELLAGINQKKLHEALVSLLGMPVCFVNDVGEVVFGEKQGSPLKHAPICAEMETIGYLEIGEEGGGKLEAAVSIIELLLKSSARYLMASNLHLHAVNDDYEKLKQKHAALMESEARYKDLSKNLEQRVQEQLKTIELTQRQLYQSEKLASVGQLAAGVAHEINNPIGFMASNLKTAQTYLDDFKVFSEELSKETNVDELTRIWVEMGLDNVIKDFHVMMEETIDGATRIANIVRDLKGFSNVDGNEEGMTDINECIRKVCNIVSGEYSRQTKWKQEFGDIPLILCRAGQLGQAFLNILLNADQAVMNSGKITIQTSYENHRIYIRVIDTGIGIENQILNRVFEPFFTTRDVGEGAGLGLTVSRDIVRSHGGEISIESMPGTGTTVIIWLPVNKEL